MKFLAGDEVKLRELAYGKEEEREFRSGIFLVCERGQYENEENSFEGKIVKLFG